MGGEAHPGDAGASPSSATRRWLWALLTAFSAGVVLCVPEADYVPEAIGRVGKAASCHGQGACFWPLGGGGQRCCSRGCNTRQPLPSLSRPPPPPDPPHPTPTDNKERCRPASGRESAARAAAPPIPAHQELRVPHQIIQRRVQTEAA